MTSSYYIETYGCSLNLSDTEFMEARLEEAGFLPAESAEDADLLILNTCTVKDRTWFNFVKRVREYEKKKKRTSGGTFRPALVIAGCIPRANPDREILKDYGQLGTDALPEIVEVANAALEGKRIRNIESSRAWNRLNAPHARKNPVIEILPIAAGCLGSCAYCQTRFARGSLKSYPGEAVVDQAKKALDGGVREIWITAQDTGAWGKDRGSQLPVLLEKLLETPGEYRVRLGMANPNHVVEFLDRLLEIFHDKRMFRFLHLPLQSGSNRVLELMNRKYRVEDFIKICEAARRFDRDFSISTDIIAGFPGEREEDFEKSLEVLERIRPAVVNRSRYSARPGTQASKMRSLPSKEISIRSRRLSRLVEKISLENNRAWVGGKENVLIDMQKREDSVISRNLYYKSIIIPMEEIGVCERVRFRPGNFAEVRITGATVYHLEAAPIKETGGGEEE